MKKKNLLYLLAIVMVAALGLNFASCSKKKEKSGDGGGTGSSLIGKWRKMDDDGTLKHTIWAFEANGTMYEYDIDDQGKTKEGSTETFKYKVENQHLFTDKLRESGGYEGEWKDEGAISIANGILTVTRDSGKIKRYKKIL